MSGTLSNLIERWFGLETASGEGDRLESGLQLALAFLGNAAGGRAGGDIYRGDLSSRRPALPAAVIA